MHLTSILTFPPSQSKPTSSSFSLKIFHQGPWTYLSKNYLTTLSFLNSTFVKSSFVSFLLWKAFLTWRLRRRNWVLIFFYRFKRFLNQPWSTLSTAITKYLLVHGWEPMVRTVCRLPFAVNRTASSHLEVNKLKLYKGLMLETPAFTNTVR